MMLLLLTGTSPARCSYLELGCNLLLLSNALLGPCVCCSIWGFCIQRKWQTWRNSMPASNSALQWGEMLWENMNCYTFWESGQLGEHKFLYCFPRSKAVCLLKMTSKTDKNVNWVKELALTNRRITICKVAVNFIGSFQSIWTDNLNMHQNSAKFMFCLLSEEQNTNHVTYKFSGYKQNVIPHPP